MRFFLFFFLFVQFLIAQETLYLNQESGEGKIIFVVENNIDTVMDAILDLESYPQKIDNVQKVTIYLKTDTEIDATIYISSFFIDFHNSVIHKIDKKHYTLLWHLDQTKENYFQEMNGSWSLQKVGEKTQITYKNQLKFKGWVPFFLQSYLLQKGLHKSTDWLRHL